jgi:hypothetical protein
MFNEKFRRAITSVDSAPYRQNIVVDSYPQDVEYFFELYRDCFQHHVVSRLSADGRQLRRSQDQSKKRFVQIDALTAYFVKQHYKPIGLAKTDSGAADDAIRHHVADYKSEFLDILSGDPRVDNPAGRSSPGSNRLTFLIGDIGVGKSLLATRVCHDLRDQQVDEAGMRVVPIYVDLEKTLEKNDGEFVNIDEKFYRALLVQMRNELLREEDLRTYVENNVSLDDDPIQAIRSFTLSLLRHTTSTRLVLVIDNIDRFHFFYSPYVCFTEWRREQWSRIAKNVDELLEKLSDPTFLGDLRLCLLVVFRPAILRVVSIGNSVLDNRTRSFRDYAVYRLFSSFDNSDSRLSRSASKRFPILTPQDAVMTRFALMQEAIDLIKDEKESKYTLYKNILDQLRAAFKASEDTSDDRANPIRTISELSHHGPRSFIDFLGALHLDPREPYDLLERFITKQPHNLLRLYTTNLRKRYTEEQGHMPNLFLADATCSTDRRFASTAHAPHRHTYWLKYLLLRYIDERTRDDWIDEWVTLNDVLRAFCRPGQYEEHLVRFCLGVLAHANQAACIQVDETTNDTVTRLKLTRRGRRMLRPAQPQAEVALCFDFDYLQFVIDDYFLALPREAFPRVFVDADLSYMFRAKAIHTRSLHEYLERKVPAVIHFIRILEAAAAAEKKCRHVGAKEIQDLYPRFDSIRTHLIEVLEKILPHSVSGGTEMLENARKLIDELAADKRFDGYFAYYGMANEPLVQAP